MPVIEAQASGIPVITSNNTSLSEISGGASILVEPTEINEIVDAIELVCGDIEIVKQKIKLGLENAKNYSWTKTASIVEHYIKKLL